MSATSFTVPGLAPSSPPALVIEPVVPHLLVVLSALSSLGFDVTVADTFKDAKAALTRAPHPALLVTGVRLAEYNGLHLALRAASLSPRVATVVTSEVDDPVLETEAERLGATFVVMPAAREDVMAAIARTVLQCRTSECGDRAPIRAPFERRRGDRRIVSDPASGFTPERRHVERRRDPAEALRSVSGAP